MREERENIPAVHDCLVRSRERLSALCSTPAIYCEPSFAARGIIQTMCHPSGERRMPTFPVPFDGAPAPVTPTPLLGDHTAEVFADWLGISAADLKSLRDEGVV